jgi:hypothetical protein
MSWNLLIYRIGATEQTEEPLGDLEAVTAAFNGAFEGLEWNSPTEAALPVDGGFILELAVGRHSVQNIYTKGGYNHLKELAALCKREGWRMADAQEGADIDLANPYSGYEQ